MTVGSEQKAVSSKKSSEKPMTRSILFWLLAAVLLTSVSPAEAQHPKKIPRIGYLSPNSPSTNPARLEAFRQGLRELGYVEGKNIFVEYRNAEGKLDRLPALAAELVRLKVEVIVTAGPASNRAAKPTTVTIPIVLVFDDDPVGSGYAASLARPGGNITGLSTLSPEISGKHVELLREIVPKLSRVAVLGNASQPGNPQALREINLTADAFGVQVQYLEVQGPKDIETAFREASKERADAVLVLSTTILYFNRRQVSDLA